MRLELVGLVGAEHRQELEVLGSTPAEGSHQKTRQGLANCKNVKKQMVSQYATANIGMSWGRVRSTEVAFALHTQRPWVWFLAFPRNFSLEFVQINLFV